jgi:2-hydroxy-6-oxonona-2,4-dienedioate hydrolase
MDAIELPREALELLARATRVETPCGDGSAVWHAWGTGEPVVLLHGGSGSWNHWVRNIASLEAAGRQVLVPDLPGFGDSAVPHGGSDADAVVAPLVQGLALLAGERPVDVVAFSFGSLVAVLLAAQHPDRIARLVLVGAPVLPLPRGRGVALKSLRAGASPEERREVHRFNLAAIMLHHAQSVDETALALQSLNVPRDRMKRRSLVTTGAFRDALVQLRCPYRAIYGAEDVLYRSIWPQVEDTLNCNSRFEGMVVIPDAGHWVQYEEAQRFNALMLEALKA